MTDTTQPSLRDQANTLLALVESMAPDPEPFDINHFVQRLLAHYGRIAIIWAVEDVQGIRPDLTADQAWEVLYEAGRKHDADWGISWSTLGDMADILFADAPQTDQAEEAQP